MLYTRLFISLVSFYVCKCDDEYLGLAQSPLMTDIVQRHGRTFDYPDRNTFGRGGYNKPEPVSVYRNVYANNIRPNPDFPEQQGRMYPQFPEQGRVASPQFPERGGRIPPQFPGQPGRLPYSGSIQNRDAGMNNRQNDNMNSEKFVEMMMRIDDELFLSLIKRNVYKDKQRIIHLVTLFSDNFARVCNNFKLRNENGARYISILWDVGGPRTVRVPMRYSSFNLHVGWTREQTEWLLNRFEQIDHLWYSTLFRYFRRYIWTEPFERKSPLRKQNRRLEEEHKEGQNMTYKNVLEGENIE